MFADIRNSPPSQEEGAYRIRWWQDGHAGESICRRTSRSTLAEAQEVLDLLAADPAAGGFQCSWLEPEDFDAIPF